MFAQGFSLGGSRMRCVSILVGFIACLASGCATNSVNLPLAIPGSGPATEARVAEIVEELCLERVAGGDFDDLAAGLWLSPVPNFLAVSPDAPTDFPDLAYAHPEAPRLIVFERAAPQYNARGCTLGVYDGDANIVLERIQTAFLASLSEVAEPLEKVRPLSPESVDMQHYDLFLRGDGIRYALRITSDAEVRLDVPTGGKHSS